MPSISLQTAESQQTVQVVLPLRHQGPAFPNGAGFVTDAEPSSSSKALANTRYLADQLMSEYDCHIELLPARGSGHGAFTDPSNKEAVHDRPYAAVSIIGGADAVQKVRDILFQAQLLQHYEYKPVESGEGQISGIAQALFGTDLAIAKGQHEKDQLTESIQGNRKEIFLLHYRNLARSLERNEKCFTAEVSIPSSIAGLVTGRAGDEQIGALLQKGVVVDVVGNCSIEAIGSAEETAVLFLSSQDRTALEEAKKEIQKMVDASKVFHETLACTERLQEWLGATCKERIEGLASFFAVSVAFSAEGIRISGGSPGPILALVQEIWRMTYDRHQMTVWFPPNSDTSARAELIEHVAQGSGLEVVCSHGHTLELEGRYEELQVALRVLCAWPIPAQVRYRLTHSEEVREFISGKKDGKLIKIMKETGVSLSLHPQENAAGGHIEIEMTSHDAEALLAALDSLLGEFPAEHCFYLSDAHHKRLIGHGGKNIQRVMKKHAVYVKFLSTDEAKVQAGLEAYDRMPRGHQTRIPNVLIKTPAKNHLALDVAKLEILALAEEREIVVQRRPLKLSRRNLLTAKEHARSKLHELMGHYTERLDFQIVPEKRLPSSQDDDCFPIEVAGDTAAMASFFEAFAASENNILLALLYAQPPPAQSPPLTPLAMTPASPSFSAALTGNYSAVSWSSSIKSQQSWTGTSDSPDLFRLFPSAVFSSPVESKSISKYAAATTPTLSDASSLEMRSLLSDLEPNGKLFDPRIGSEVKAARHIAACDGNCTNHYRLTSSMVDFIRLDWDSLAARKKSTGALCG